MKITLKPATSDARSISLFILGLGTTASASVIGQLYLADAMFLLALPFILATCKTTFSWKIPSLFICLIITWLLSLMVSDIVRESPFVNYSRGWSKLSFLMAAFLGVLILSDLKMPRLVAYLGGIVAAKLFWAVAFPDPYQIGSPWKFGFGPPLSMLAAIVACYPLARPVADKSLLKWSLPLAIVSATSLIMNSRSVFGIVAAALMLTGLSVLAQRLFPRKRLATPMIMAVFLIVGALGTFGLVQSYSMLASSGALGVEAKHKYDLQTRLGMGLILGGRSESLISTRVISDSPFIGQGSWPENRYYASLFIQMRRDRGIRESSDTINNLIPTHSYFLSSWVEAGIVGAFFWVACIVAAFSVLLRSADIRWSYLPLVCFTTISFLWDIAFSPFGGGTRFMIAGQLCVILATIRYLAGPQPAPKSHTAKQRRYAEPA